MSRRSSFPPFSIAFLVPGLLFSQTTIGDRLVVGSMSSAAYGTLQQSIPLPSFVNQKFCDTVQLSSGVFYEAYVPTAAERSGNFSAFSGLLVDPDSKQPFAGGIIPANRIPGLFAWRVASPPGGAGPNCVKFPTGYVPFSTVNYVTAAISGTRQFVLTPSALIFDYTASIFFSPTQAISAFSTGASVSFTVTSAVETPAGGRWLSIRTSGAGSTGVIATPANVEVTVDPTGLAPGIYSGGVRFTVSSDLPTLTVPVTLIVRQAIPTVVVPKFIEFSFGPGEALIPRTTAVPVRSSLGPAVRFTVKPVVKTPTGYDWISASSTPLTAATASVSESSASLGAAETPATVSVTVNPAGLGPGTYLGFVRFTATNACAGTADQRTASHNAEGDDVAQLMAVLMRIQGGATQPLILTPDRFFFPPSVGAASFFVSSAPSPIDPAVGLNLKVQTLAIDPAGGSWLLADPVEGINILTPITVTVKTENLLANVDYSGYVAVEGIIGNTTAGAVLPVSFRLNAALDSPEGAEAGPVSEAAATTGSPPHADAAGPQIIAQVADGAGWKTTIILVNTDTGSAQNFTLRFNPGSGTPSTLPLVLEGPDQLSNFVISRSIPAGGSLTLLTRGSDTGALWQGWAELISTGGIGGTAIFRKQVTATQDSEGAVPIKPSTIGRFLLPFDNLAGSLTTMALVNPNASQSTRVTVNLRGESGEALGTPVILTLAARGHDAFALHDRFPGAAGRRGVAEFTASCGEVAGLGLRFNTRLNAFSSFETIDPDQAGSPSSIAHIVDGSNWKTTIILTNADTRNAAKFTLRFWPGKDTAATRPPDMGGGIRLNGFSLADTIPAGGSRTIETLGSDSGALWQGWADVTTTSGSVAGLAVFRQLVPGGSYAEGAVPITTARNTRFLLPIDNLSGFLTTMAIANPSAQLPGAVNATFRAESGQGIAGSAGSVPLARSGHDSFALSARFPRLDNLRGVADFSAAGPILGIGLRFNPRFAFTSLPILRK